MTVLLRLVCFHARAATIAWIQANGGDCAVPANWNSKRPPVFHPVIAVDEFNQLTPGIRIASECRVPRGFGLRQSPAAFGEASTVSKPRIGTMDPSAPSPRKVLRIEPPNRSVGAPVCTGLWGFDGSGAGCKPALRFIGRGRSGSWVVATTVPITEMRCPVCASGDAGPIDAAAGQVGLKTGIGNSPPAPGAPGRNGTPAFSCVTLDEDGYQVQASAPLAQSNWNHLGGVLDEANAFLTVIASTASRPRHSPLVLIL
jgi:hypothetical protein